MAEIERYSISFGMMKTYDDPAGPFVKYQDHAQALTEARAEIERRDAFIKELSDALRSVRPLGGSELFVKRFGNYYADPTYCKAAIEQDAEHKHNAMKAYVKERRRASAAESELSTLRDMLVLCGELGGLGKDETPAAYLRRLIDEVAGVESLRARVREVVGPFARADAAIGSERGPFRFETGTGYRLIEREDLRAARQLNEDLK